MEESVLVKAIGSHIDELSNMTEWLIPTILIVAVSALNYKYKTIKLLSIELSQDAAILFTDTIVACYSVSVLLIVLRLQALFKRLSPDSTAEAFNQMVTHEWLLNPFSFFGGGHPLLTYTSTFLVIFFYVVCNDATTFFQGSWADGSKYKIRTLSKRLDFYICLFNFLNGFVILGSIYLLFKQISVKLASSHTELSQNISSAHNIWIGFAALSVFVSVIIDLKIMDLIVKNSDEDEP